MGYVNDTQMSSYMPAEDITPTVGSWSMAVASNLWTLNKTAADNTSVLKIPVRLPRNAVALKGAYLKSIDIWWSVATAALDALSAAIFKASLPAQAGTHSTAALGFTYDAAHDTAGERVTAGTHRMSLALVTPLWVDDDDDVYVELTVDAATTSVVKLIGARANYTLRL